MNRTILFSILIFAGLLGTSCSEQAEKSTASDSAAIPVTVTITGTEGAASFFSVSGRVAATKTARLSTRMMGYVTRVHVKVGQQVREGQLLVSLQNEGIQAKLAQTEAGIAEASAAFENARRDYERFQNLYAEQSASQKELDDMRARFEMARARLRAAEQMKKEVDAEMAYVAIRAPFPGQVTQTYVEAGDLANPGMPLLALEDPNHFEVRSMIPENEVSAVREGMEVVVTVQSPGLQLKGIVTELSSSAMATGGQYLATVDLPSGTSGLRSGMYANVRFPAAAVEAASGTLLIPGSAVVRRGQLTGVYTVSKSQTALLRWVRLGREFGDQVAVLSGLQPGESLIVSSRGRLYNGARIEVQ